MSGYVVAKLEEIEELDDGRAPYRPVRHHLGITSFGVNAWSAANAGDRIINEHDEADEGEEELYLVTNGRAAFELDGQAVDAPAGTFVAVKPGVTRTAVGEEAGTTIVAIGSTPGRAYEASGWELWAPIRPLYDAGNYADAADRARELAAQNPQYAAILYNLACCESLAGRSTEAIESLRRALELSDSLRRLAAEDSDLDPIRDEPSFKELLAERQ